MLAQLNATVGALEENAQRAAQLMHHAEQAGADLLIFPELFLTGYPPQDLLFDKMFIHDTLELTQRLAHEAGQTLTIIGTLHQPQEGQLYNTAACLQDGRVKDWIHKSLLPTCDVFDEWRYFRPGRDNHPVKLKTRSGETVRLGIHICEDLWDEKVDYKVSDRLAEMGVDLFINISASPFHYGKIQERSRLVLGKVHRFHKPFIYLNLIGGQDQLVFDGFSLVADREGNWLHLARQFEEEVALVEIPLKRSIGRSLELKTTPKEEEVHHAIILGIKDYFRKTGHSQAVLGLSGGVDSAVTAVLAAEALSPENVLGIAMPSKYSSPESLEDAALLSKNLGTEYQVIPIDEVFEAFQQTFAKSTGSPLTGVAEENLQARIRGNILMSISNRSGRLLLTTGNKTEIALGYCTLYGDTSGGLAVISDLGKQTVYAVARYVNRIREPAPIPERILTKKPSAELRPNQVDPFDYEIVAPLVNDIVERRLTCRELIAKGYEEELVRDILLQIRRAEYKRQQMPPGIKVSVKAFGMGRRMPIINHYHPNNCR